MLRIPPSNRTVGRDQQKSATTALAGCLNVCFAAQNPDRGLPVVSGLEATEHSIRLQGLRLRVGSAEAIDQRRIRGRTTPTVPDVATDIKPGPAIVVAAVLSQAS